MTGPGRGLSSYLKTVGGLLVALFAWQALYLLRLVPREAVPSPLSVAFDIWSNRDAYLPNLGATLLSATLGYLAGNLVAVSAAVLFALWPTVERLARGFNLIAFAIPPITLGPLLAIAFQGMTPQVILAAVGVYFTTMTVTLVSLREVDPSALELIKLYGGGEGQAMRLVRLRSALPMIMSGLRAGATASLLGAMLAEFGSGAPGLGSFLLASMSLGQPERVWGIALVATSVSLIAYGLLTKAAAVLSWRPVSTLSMGGAIRELESGPPASAGRSLGQILLFGVAALLPFLVWQALPDILHVSPAVVRTPLSLWSYIVTDPDASTAQQSLLSAATQTLPMAFAAMLLGCAAALLLSLASMFHPGLARIVLGGVILLQSTPLVALTPLIVLVLGRGAVATFAIAISVCFFPAFVTLSQAVKTVPKVALDLLYLHNGSRLQAIRFVILPYMTPYLFSAARLVAPTGLLGVMTAEWLATGYGLGGLMNEARGDLDYGMIWTVAFIAVALAALLYQLILAGERAAQARIFRV